jgi:ribosomal peptide maturation radical SAM protein 1
MKVLLLSMPFGAVDRPALGLSILKAALTRRDISCDVRYLFDDYVEMIGLRDYEWLTDELPYTCFAGDWCFTLALYGRQPALDWGYVRNVLRGTWRLSKSDIERIVRIREASVDYINACVTNVDWGVYDVVGFTSTFVQNIASLALAKRLKINEPHLKIVFGGANWEGEMGQVLHQQFPFVDFVCSGEADNSFPELVESLSQRTTDFTQINGVLSRNLLGNSQSGKPAEVITDMDALPVPDFADYFAMLNGKFSFAPVTPTLLMETSRGCWWGAKRHCTFCGLNGNGMMFRSKSGARALQEMDELVETWSVPLIAMVDNILDMGYFKTLLPLLAKRELRQHIFYETKANLSRSQVRLLALAGISNIQPGIESLSNHILELMRKGTTALRNIQLLKWCKEYEVCVDWNMLYGFPGETDEDYLCMFNYLPEIRHLQAPSGSGPIRLDRFSPYYESPESFGLSNIRAMEVFRYIYPFDEQTRNRIACYFDFDYSPGQEMSQKVHSIIDYIKSWSEDPAPGDLMVVDKSQSLLIHDTRSTHEMTTYELKGYDRVVYLLCDEIAGTAKIFRELSTIYPGIIFDVNNVKTLLTKLTSLGLVARDGERYLALGVYSNFPFNWKSENLVTRALDRDVANLV